MKYLFVFGCPRSGTTALARMLNWHPAIALGIERFRDLAKPGKLQEFTPALFEPGRLLDIRPTDTRGAKYNQHLAAKLDGTHPIQMVGDKIPYLYLRLDHVCRAFPDAHMIAILRDPEPVALSWQRRADEPGDPWPAHQDAAAAFVEWERSVSIISEQFAKQANPLTIIDYDRFLRVPDALTLAGNAERLFTVLGLASDPDALLRQATPTMRNAMVAQTRERHASPEIIARAAELRRNPAYQALIARSV
jgi:hypothetical protein